MEVRVLEYFLAVAREESISGAADSLHLTQPTLSRQLKDLEDELGKMLFTRGRRITLTDDGLLLRKRAEEIVELVRKTEKEVMENDESITGDIYIGAGETRRGMSLIFDIAHRMQEEYPDVKFHVSSGDAQDISYRLSKGLDDFVLFMGAVDESRYDYLELSAKDRWGVLVRQDDPLAGKEKLTPHDIKSRPLILSRQAGSIVQVSKWLGVPEAQLNITGTYNLIYNGSLMVEEGMGIALTLDGLIYTSDDTPLTFRPLSPGLPVNMYLAWKKYPVFSPAAGRFLEMLREMIS